MSLKIAVVGCGALGGFYGAKLSRAGHDVHFLLRSDYEAVLRDGLQVRSRAGDFTARPRCAQDPGEIGPADLVLIGLKTTANHAFPRLLPPLVGHHTRVLTLQNGLGNEEQLAALFPADQILGGLCFVCLNRIAPGVVHHLDHGRIVLGEFGRPAQPRTHELAALFQQAGVSCEVTGDLARAHWEKLVWNIPFNGLGVASCAGLAALGPGAEPIHPREPCRDTAALLGDPPWESLVRELMHEVIATAHRLGYPVEESLAHQQIERTRSMGAYRASTLVDFERGQVLELESLFLEPLRHARQAGVATPRLEALCRVLQALAPAPAAQVPAANALDSPGPP
ncbi:MAG: 2-dehydropantoate 2-reductase [Verrucomicrobiota bacterium]|jgi:2-dehydropantoate 2-reductase